MYALDFEYDGQKLSDKKFIICDFNSPSGADTISAGSKISFNTVSRHSGKRFGLSSTNYEECFECKFHICKHPDMNDDMEISTGECRNLVRWLNRREFLPFKFIFDNDDVTDRIFDASFNISRIEINKKLYGLELEMHTNRPFAYSELYGVNLNFEDISAEGIVIDGSDEIGYIYPDMKIECLEDGDLEVRNKTIECIMAIKNCKAGEIIQIQGDAMIITSSESEHAIYDDFNYRFLRIGNTMETRENIITANLPCKIQMRYRALFKGVF